MPAESLVPGYKLVETFGPDSEYETRPSVDSGDEEEVEEEVEYVTLEISGIADVDPNLLTSYRLIGVDTPTPFLQLSSSGTIFKGRHHKLLGTELLFSHAQGDSDPSARHISLLGTTEQRIVFSPVEIRNPASSSSTSRSTSKAKTPAKESNSKKGKKKANAGTSGIEEVAGSLGVGISKSSTLVDQGPITEPDSGTRGQVTGEKKDEMLQDDNDNDDMYATEDDYGNEDEGGKTLEADVGDQEDVGAEEGVGANPDLPPQKKRKPTRNDKGKSVVRSIKGPATMGSTSTSTPTPTTPAMIVELNLAQGQHQQGTPSTGDDIPMAIDPALETLQVPSNRPPSQASERDAGTQ